MVHPNSGDGSGRRGVGILVKVACLACGFLSCAFVAFGITGMIQTFFIDIPEGKIVRMEPTKGGVWVYLDNGEKGVFPDWFGGNRKPRTQTAKLDERGFLRLVPGDTVAKPVHGYVYKVNGAPLTDMRWEIDNNFLDNPAWVLFALFVVLAIAHEYILPGANLLDPNDLEATPPAQGVERGVFRGLLRNGILRPLRTWLLGLLIIFVAIWVAIWVLTPLRR